MIAVAFKRYRQGNFVDDGIREVTKGDYIHVELAFLNGANLKTVDCYSARLGTGTSFLTLDLTDAAMWTVCMVQLTPAITASQEALLHSFCLGSAGRPYDEEAILGIAAGLQTHVKFARFCSNEVGNALQQVLGMFPHVSPWDFIPSGSAKGRVSLYNLVTTGKP